MKMMNLRYTRMLCTNVRVKNVQSTLMQFACVANIGKYVFIDRYIQGDNSCYFIKQVFSTFIRERQPYHVDQLGQ
jgi:hypothetical protein